MHSDHGIPLGIGHVHQHPVAEDPGVVDQHVESAERVDRRVDQSFCPLPVTDVFAVRHRLGAGATDLLHHLACGPVRRTAPVDLGSEVVDHDLGALACEFDGVLPADAPARTGDHGDPSLTDTGHEGSSPPDRLVGSSGHCLSTVPVPEHSFVDLAGVLPWQ
jgi:hypothetical protein